MKKKLRNTQPCKDSDALSNKGFDRIRDQVYRALMRAERGMPDARRNLASVLTEASNLLNTNPSPELKQWLHAITPAAIGLLAESQCVRNGVADRTVVN